MKLRVVSLGLILILLAAAAIIVGGTETYNGLLNQTPVSIKFNQFEHYIHARQAGTTPQNTTVVQDNHEYYLSTYYPPGPDADDLWFDLANQYDVDVVVANISDKFRYYSIHDLPFEFQFYGHEVNQVGISTGGFLYVGPWFHNQVQLTQFIAPLQGDFNPGINDTALIYIYEDDDRYTVQWDQVHNHDHVDAGPFTFQVSLFRNGTIHFVYRNIPLSVTEIDNDDHPVFVGLADSFYFDTTIPGGFISRSIFEYHRILLNDSVELTDSAYVITPMPNCISVNLCDECVARSQSSTFSCGWCGELNRCSDGVDRHRQEWLASGCFLSRTTNCEPPTTLPPTTLPPTIITIPTTTATEAATTAEPTASELPTPPSMSTDTQTTKSTVNTATTMAGTPVVAAPIGSSLGTGPVIAIVVVAIALLIIVVLVAASVVVLWYGYKNPTSSIGLFMIEHRPKARSLNKTAASYNVESGKTALSDGYP